MVIDNKPGGSATLGPATMASNAKPDGYTIGQIAIPVFRVPYMQKATFDPVTDFTYIIHLGGYTLGAVVKADGPFKKWQDVIEFAKANPGKFTYATIGPATTNAIAMELMAQQSGVKFTHIPTKGGGESIANVLGGHVMAMVESPAWAPLVASGQFRLLMVLNGQRSKKWPDTPTLKELGYTYEFELALRPRRPQGHRPRHRQEAARCLQEGLRRPEGGRALREVRLHAPLHEYGRLSGLRAEARRRGEGGAREDRPREGALRQPASA